MDSIQAFCSSSSVLYVCLSINKQAEIEAVFIHLSNIIAPTQVGSPVSHSILVFAAVPTLGVVANLTGVPLGSSGHCARLLLNVGPRARFCLSRNLSTASGLLLDSLVTRLHISDRTLLGLEELGSALACDAESK